MRFVSLFAGIGGFDLGLERAGMTCVGQVEIDPYCKQVLAKHWPDVPRISDIYDFNGDEFGEYDLLCGGYPCQPFSLAGNRAGEADERHLWPEVARIIRDTRPRWVLLENVPGHLSLGFGDVLGDLAACGYDAEWDCIPASAVGAPHRRDRVWIIAYPNRDGRNPHNYGETSGVRLRDTRESSVPRHMAYPDSEPINSRLDRGGTSRRETPTPARPLYPPDESGRSRATEMAHPDSERSQGWGQHRQHTTQRPTRQGSQPDTGHWRVEPDVGRVAHGVPRRVDRLRSLGNAVVPQVVQYLGEKIVRQHRLSGVTE